MMTDYADLFEKASVLPDKRTEIECRVSLIAQNQPTYEKVEGATEIPWWCVAAIHNLESTLNFRTHLHNGDPLTARTIHVPRNRPFAAPASGHFPYEWSESAIDALSNRWTPKTWGLSGCLEFLERYNGLGYRVHGINTPYLWSFTDQYTSGLFVFDGQFSPKIASEGIGGAALLKILEEKGLVKFDSSN